MYPKLFHVDYSSGGESARLYFILLVNLTSVVTEVVMGFFHLLIYLLANAFFYGFYHLIVAISPSTVPATGKMGTIEDVLTSVFMGLLFFHCLLTLFFTVVCLIPMAIVVVTYFVFKSFMFIFSKAWKYLTVDVGLVDAPV